MLMLIDIVLFSCVLISNVLLCLISYGESPLCFVFKCSATRAAATGRGRRARGGVALGDANSNSGQSTPGQRVERTDSALSLVKLLRYDRTSLRGRL